MRRRKSATAMPLANIPRGLEIHNIEMNPGQGGKLVRIAPVASLD